MNSKYFKSLPEQEYIFTNFFTCAKNEGMCCSDCGTYITNVVQVTGRADRQAYYLGTSCCNKISKDRSVFLTPVSEQRKKIFMTAFQKFSKIKADLEDLAEKNGGAVAKFIDVDTDYRLNLRLTLFIFCANGLLIFNYFDEAQRCLKGLAELIKGYDFTFEIGDLFSRVWNNETLLFIKKIVGSAWAKVNPDMWGENKSLWENYLQINSLKDKWVHFENTEMCHKSLKELDFVYKTHPQIF